MSFMLLLLTALTLGFSSHFDTNNLVDMDSVLGHEAHPHAITLSADTQTSSSADATISPAEEVSETPTPAEETTESNTDEDTTNTEATPTPTATPTPVEILNLDLRTNLDLQIDPITGDATAHKEQVNGEGSSKAQIKLPSLPILGGSSESTSVLKKVTLKLGL